MSQASSNCLPATSSGREARRGLDVVGREDNLSGTAESLHGHAPVGVRGSDRPAVAVLHPPAAGSQPPHVLPGDDEIAVPCVLSPGHLEPSGLTCPAPTRSARARALSSATVAESGAIMRVSISGPAPSEHPNLAGPGVDGTLPTHSQLDRTTIF
jgi:hypothetical protein